jgi:hypothetical protein
VHQLAQALQDFAGKKPLRAVDEHGHIKTLPDGTGELMINDVYLRGEFPPPGKASAPRPGDTPDDQYHNRIGEFTAAMEYLDQAFLAIGQVIGNDGRPLVEDRGVDTQSCGAWRETLARIDEELVIWSRKFKQVYGIAADSASAARHHAAEDERDDTDANDSGDDADDTTANAPLQ